MNLWHRVHAKLAQMVAARVVGPADPTEALAWLDQLAGRVVSLHMEMTVYRMALLAQCVSVSGWPEGEKPSIENLVGGICWDYGALGGELADLGHVLAAPVEQKTVVAPRPKLVSLH
jgi:hypothetical protein